MIRTRLVKVDDTTIHTYTQGNHKVRVYGEQLNERDFGVFMVIVELAKINANRRLTGHLSDIARAEGLTNIYQASSLNSIDDSINTLLDIHIRVRPINGKGLSGSFHLVEGWLDSGGTFDLTITPYLEKISELKLGIAFVNLNIYQATPNQLARAMIRFLSSHEIFYKNMTGRYYSIRLSRLLDYLGYDTTYLHWFVIRPRITRAIEECIRVGFLDEQSHPKHLSEADKKLRRTDGGILNLYPAMVQLAEKTKPTVEIKSTISNNLCPLGFIFGKEHDQRVGCHNCEDANYKLFSQCKLSRKSLSI
jgi:hypothetical protein